MHYDEGHWSDDWMMRDDGSGWLMGIFGLLLVLILIALVVWVVAMLVRGPHPLVGGAQSISRERGGVDAEAILAERLARGEIDPEEYAARRSALREPG